MEHETVEPVGLDLTGEQGLERRPHLVMAVVVDLDPAGYADSDVVDEALGALDHEAVRVLVDRAEPDMAEHRQQIGERDRLATPVDPHPPFVLGIADVANERGTGGRPRVDQLEQSRQVSDRGARVDARPIRTGGRHRCAREQQVAPRFTELVDRGLVDTVEPCGRDVVDHRRQPVEVGRFAVGPFDGERDAGQAARPEERFDLVGGRAVLLGDGGSDPLGQLGVEPLLRQEHEHGRPVADGFRNIEHPHDLALLHADDIDHELREPARVQFEHEVARQRLEHVAHRPAGMRLRSVGCEPEHGPGEVTDRREREHALPVRGRRQQTDEPLGDPLAGGVVAQHGDRGEARWPVDGRYLGGS